MADAVTAGMKISKKIGRGKVPKNKSAQGKPDVVLITKNVTVPIMRPVKIEKSYPMHGAMRESTQIIRTQQNKRMERLSFLEPPQNIYRNEAEEQYEVSKNKQIHENPVSMPPRNSSIIEEYFRTKPNNTTTRKKDKLTLPFPNTTLKPRTPSISHEDRVKTRDQENLPPHDQSPFTSRSTDLPTKTAPQNHPSSKQNKKQLKRTTKRHAPPQDDSNISHGTFVINKLSDASTSKYPNDSSLRAVLNFRITESSTSDSSTPEKSSRDSRPSAESLQERNRRIVGDISLSTRSERELNFVNYKDDPSSLVDSRPSVVKSLKCLAETESLGIVRDKVPPLGVVKYSWQDMSWIPPCRRKKESCTMCEEEDEGSEKSEGLDCKIKYSWQVIGTGSQTSRTLLQDLLDGGDGSKRLRCDVKYSWQIIGTATQASMENCGDADYWHGFIVSPRANYGSLSHDRSAEESVNGKTRVGRGFVILNNRDTQTIAQKQNQTDFTDCRARYSWENVIKRYL